MYLESRLRKLEDQAGLTKEPLRIFLMLNSVGRTPGTLCVSGLGKSLTFKNKEDFSAWAREDGMSEEEIAEMIKEMNW